MTSAISNDIRSNGPLAESVREANALLATVAGASAEFLEANWRLDEDTKKRPILTLNLSDWTGSVSTKFSPDELSKPYHLYSRLHQLWGELLQVRSQAQLKKLDASIKEVVGGV